METVHALAGTADGPPGLRQRLQAPVVVLTCGRSGSTLLRFMLDAHPALACPAETGLIDLSMRMAVLSKLLDGPATQNRQGRLSELGAKSIRNWVSVTFGAYLAQAGKSRWCDKSLGSADAADKFLEIFPEAQFICLYRNCMDVVDSALEACPYGLHGYGLDPFAAGHPGNSVAAVADYWVCHTRTILHVEKEFPDSCLRLRYEDLVTDPEGQAARLFGFLGEEQAPGIASACLARSATAFGPSDHKIWATSKITDSSVGRGRRLPWHMIAPPVLRMVNDLLSQLGYTTIEKGWEDRPPLSDMAEAGHAEPPRAMASVTGSGGMTLDDLGLLLTERVANWSPDVLPAILGGDRLAVLVTIPATATVGVQVAAAWQLDLVSRTVSQAGLGDRSAAGQSPPDDGSAEGWTFAGDIDTFEQVLSGRLNLASAIRTRQLRIARQGSQRDLRAQSGALARVSLPLIVGEPRIKVLSHLFRPRQAAAAAAGRASDDQ